MIQLLCPICNRRKEATSQADWSDFPFCSSRCRLIDLGRWLGESYRIAGSAEEEEEAAADNLDTPQAGRTLGRFP